MSKKRDELQAEVTALAGSSKDFMKMEAKVCVCVCMSVCW